MAHFNRVGAELYCEQVPLMRIAQEYGTPAYVYSAAALRERAGLFSHALSSLDFSLCYSVKSNSNIAILNLLSRQGVGADIVSGGELFRCLKAGIPAKRIVYSGVGKTADEITYALQSGIGMFNVESAAELDAISVLAARLNIRANIALRVNPDVDAKTHEKTTTAKKENKFGVAYNQVIALYQHAQSLPNIDPIGIDVHLGSPIYSLEPYQQALNRIEKLLIALREAGIPITTLDIGGGYAIVYHNEAPFTLEQFAKLIVPFVKKYSLKLLVEPGRFISGNSAVLLTELTYIKKSYDKTFYLCNAGMNDLIRPAFYDSFHAISPVILPENTQEITADIVGPICESSDYFAKNRQIAVVPQGSILAIMSAGAYGFTMASNYNSRPRPVEIIIDNTTVSCIRTRETYADIIRGESIPL